MRRCSLMHRLIFSAMATQSRGVYKHEALASELGSVEQIAKRQNGYERRGASPIPLTLENTIAGEYRHASPTEPNELKKHEEFRRITISKETTKRLQY